MKEIIQTALREDATDKDITTNSLIPKVQISQAKIFAKEAAVICGLEIAKAVFKTLDRKVQFRTHCKDGGMVKKNAVIATIRGKTRAILTGERTALNFFSYLSGIATMTRQFVDKARGTKAQILDTRKTTPGLRELEKYAVRCGGGKNHRANLAEMVMIKDNHRESCELSIPHAIRKVRQQTRKPIEIEVDNLVQFSQALTANPNIILLDNMSPQQIKKAVQTIRNLPKKRRPLLEASGGITLKNVKKVAQTGVDRISIGALTHSPRAVNFSLELLLALVFISLFWITPPVLAQEEQPAAKPSVSLEAPVSPIFDDRMLLEGYTQKYQELSKEILLEMIKDETLTSYKAAAAIRVFKQNFADKVVSREKGIIEKILWRRMHRDDSPFVQVEIMHTLGRMDRYRYFKSMVPALIQKLDHYNPTVNEIAFTGLNDIISTGGNRTHEARIVFNTLRKVLFLVRKRLADVKEPDLKLKQKLQILRWSIKILGTEELKRLPKEVINLL